MHTVTALICHAPSSSPGLLPCRFSRSPPWRKYDNPPYLVAKYDHTYQVTVTTKIRVCPNKFAAFGAALGYIGYIELLATLLIAGIFILSGISKPTTKKASFLNLLRGAGIAEMDKKKNDDYEGDEGGNNEGPSFRGTRVVAMTGPPLSADLEMAVSSEVSLYALRVLVPPSV